MVYVEAQHTGSRNTHEALVEASYDMLYFITMSVNSLHMQCISSV